MTVTIDVKLRPYQLKAYEARSRFTVRVMHRRAGKSWLAFVEMLADALTTDWRSFNLARGKMQFQLNLTAGRTAQATCKDRHASKDACARAGLVRAHARPPSTSATRSGIFLAVRYYRMEAHAWPAAPTSGSNASRPP